MGNIKMKLLGIGLVLVGLIISVYGVLFNSGPATFWSIYIGMSVVMMGLGLVGLNIGYGF
jgi:uncharacterized membrane protein